MNGATTRNRLHDTIFPPSMTNPTSSPPIDPELTTATEQADLSASDGLVGGEATIDLNLPHDLNYDVDDLGNGQIVIQYWQEESSDQSATGSES